MYCGFDKPLRHVIFQSKYINCNDQRPTNEHQPGERPNLLLTPDSNLEQWPQLTTHPGTTFKHSPWGEDCHDGDVSNFSSPMEKLSGWTYLACATNTSSVARRTRMPVCISVCWRDRRFVSPSSKQNHRPQQKSANYTPKKPILVCFGKANRTLSSIIELV